MPRPSAHLDRKLIDAARELLPSRGIAGLSVREVSRRAGVNPGMFHYHFKTKDEFVRRVLGECYERFLGAFAEAEGVGPARERLRRVLAAVARFARDNRRFQSLMIRELLNADPGMRRFAFAEFPRHVAIVMRLLEECRREGSVRPLPVPALAMFAMGAMTMPALALDGFERNGVKALAGHPVKELGGLLLSDAMIDERADMVLAALAPARRRKR